MSTSYLHDSKEQLLNRIGTELAWGWSPAIDFSRLLDGRPAMQSPRTEVNHVVAGGQSEKDDIASATLPADKTTAPEEAALDALISQIQYSEREQRLGAGEGNAMGEDSPEGARTRTTCREPAVAILLAGASDVRHILRTAAALRVREAQSMGKGTNPVYHFYIYEPNLRIHCRHLFFIQWFLDSMFALEEMEERVLMFLEIFGNSLLRDATAAQVRGVAQRLLSSLKSDTGPLAPMVSFLEMKLKEKDFIEGQLQWWVKDSAQVGIVEHWSRRLRQDMAERYDNRDNLIDWDFVFHLTEYTNLLKFQEYRVWRNTGVAFDVCHINPRRGFEYEYTVPNKSLCNFDRQGRGAYCGDIKNGPFFAFGSQTGNKFIRHRSADGTCKYGNGVVSMHNVRAWLYALMTGLPWPWAEHAFAWDDPANYNYLPPNTPSSVAYVAKLPRVQFHFIGLDFSRFLLHQQEGRVPRLDAAFVGVPCAHLLEPTFFQMGMREDGVVVAETAKFVVDADDNAKKELMQKVEARASAGGWAKHDQLTHLLHEEQPPPRVHEGELTQAQQLALSRYESPHQVVFTSKP